MQLDSTEDAITYFLKHIVPMSESGTSDATSREKAARFLQMKVTQYWEPAWKFKEKSTAVSFGENDGLAALPGDFGTWDRDFGWLVWGPPYNITLNPTKRNPREIMALRTQYPTRTGSPEAVVMHNRVLARWPTKPPNGAEAATCFYHRRRPNILDLFEQEDPEEDDPQDEWSLIPIEDQEVVIDGLRAMWDSVSGDGREPAHELQFRKRVRELYKSRKIGRAHV